MCSKCRTLIKFWVFARFNISCLLNPKKCEFWVRFGGQVELQNSQVGSRGLLERCEVDFLGFLESVEKTFEKNENLTPDRLPKSRPGGPDGGERGQCKRTHFREKRQRRLHGNEILSFLWRWASIRECILHSLSPWRAASGGRPYIPPQSPRGLLQNNQNTRQMLQGSLGGSKGASPRPPRLAGILQSSASLSFFLLSFVSFRPCFRRSFGQAFLKKIIENQRPESSVTRSQGGPGAPGRVKNAAS